MTKRDDAFLRWAAGRIARAGRRDADAPAFGSDNAAAHALTPSEQRLVQRFPARGADAAGLQSAVGRLFDRHLANGRTPRFQNQLFSGVDDPAMAGALLGLFANNTVSTREIAPLPTEMERAVIAWTLRAVPWDAARAGGSATPGGSFSNLLAIYLARKAAEAR